MTSRDVCERCGAPVATGKAYCDACMAALIAEDSRRNTAQRFADSRRVLGDGCPYCGRLVCRCTDRDCAALLPEMDTEKHSEPGA